MTETDDYDGDTLLDIYPDTAVFMGHIYRPGDFQFRRRLLKTIKDSPYDQNILILNRIELLPAYRGNRLLPELIGRDAKFWEKHASLIVLKAFPLQFEQSVASPDQRRATEKLIACYKTAGFLNIPGSPDLMVRPF